jgi:hypothetical protein
VAAGLLQIPRLAGEAKSYAERLFKFPEIGRLKDDQARAALVSRAQELAPATPITLEDVTRAQPLVERKLNGSFG